MSGLFVEINPVWLEAAVFVSLALVLELGTWLSLRSQNDELSELISRALIDESSVGPTSYIDKHWRRIGWQIIWFTCVLMPIRDGVLYLAVPTVIMQWSHKVYLAIPIGILLALVEIVWYASRHDEVRVRDVLALILYCSIMLAVAVITGSLTVAIATDTVIGLPLETYRYRQTHKAVLGQRKRDWYVTICGKGLRYTVRYVGTQQ